jgi:hypothetical protein
MQAERKTGPKHRGFPILVTCAQVVVAYAQVPQAQSYPWVCSPYPWMCSPQPCPAFFTALRSLLTMALLATKAAYTAASETRDSKATEVPNHGTVV